MKINKRRGVSALIGTLLIVATGVVLSTIFFEFSMSFLGQLGGSSGAQIPRQNQASESILTIEKIASQAYVSGTNAYVYIYVRNVGLYAPLTLGSMSVSGLSTNAGFTGNVITSSQAGNWSAIPSVTVCSTTTLSATTCTSGAGQAGQPVASPLARLGTAKIILIWPSGNCGGGGCPIAGDTLSILVTTTSGTITSQSTVVP